MEKRRKIALAAAATLALGAGGIGVAVATGSDDDDGTERAITGSALDRASAAALEHTGGGEVSDTEVGDEESYYEVEVTRPDGSQVDVQLDRDFKVVSDEDDSENEPGDEGED